MMRRKGGEVRRRAMLESVKGLVGLDTHVPPGTSLATAWPVALLCATMVGFSEVEVAPHHERTR